MNFKGEPSHAVTGVFVFLLLGLFAVFSTVMVLMATKAYRGTVEHADENNNARIASSYLRTMLRADDEEGVLMIEDLDGITSITMMNDYDFESYATRIYVYEGMLRELFTEAETPFDPAWGDTVCEADSLQAEMKDGLLHVTITVNGSENEIFYAPRTNMAEGE